MSNYVFPAPVQPIIAVKGERAAYPVRRIFCVGRNYAKHAAEMGYEVDRDAPFFFTKSAHMTCASGSVIAYPPQTEDFHYEMELVVALGGPVFCGSPEQAAQAIYAYGCGLDMTRRDWQIKSREVKRPWAFGKDVENSAVFAPLTKAEAFGPISNQRIHLELNGAVRQDSTLDLLIHPVPDVIAYLSKFYHLDAGDVIMTGTPEGVGPVMAGDKITGGIDGLEPISLAIAAAD